jgi:hypothetical protein
LTAITSLISMPAHACAIQARADLASLCSLEFSTQRQERASTGTHNPKQIVFVVDLERGFDRAWIQGGLGAGSN